MKNWLKNFLKKLEEANKKNFGDQRLDCCDMSQKSNNPKTKKTK
jgi:hypothetical protein